MSDPSTAVEDVIGAKTVEVFPWLYFMWTTLLGTVIVFELIATRFLMGYLVSSILNRFVLPKHSGTRARSTVTCAAATAAVSNWLCVSGNGGVLGGTVPEIRLSTCEFAPLGGKIFVTNVHYVTKNMSLRVMDGQIEFRWWQTNPLRALRDLAVGAFLDSHMCRLNFQFKGLELCVFNNR